MAEFRQTDALLRPGTLASYQATVASVADFRGGFSSDRWDVAWNDFWCDWRAMLLLDDVEPPSWLLGDMALSAGHRGILFPSQARAGGTNLVLFVDALQDGDVVRVHDPDHALPRDQSSWSSGGM